MIPRKFVFFDYRREPMYLTEDEIETLFGEFDFQVLDVFNDRQPISHLHLEENKLYPVVINSAGYEFMIASIMEVE